MSKPKKLAPTLALNLAVRDAQCVKGVNRDLLTALINRSSYSKSAHCLGCWPSYATLAADTLRNERSLRRAAKALEDAKYIRRIYRGESSNYFIINEELITTLAREMNEWRASQKAQREKMHNDELERVVCALAQELVEEGDDDWDNNDQMMGQAA